MSNGEGAKRKRRFRTTPFPSRGVPAAACPPSGAESGEVGGEAEVPLTEGFWPLCALQWRRPSGSAARGAGGQGYRLVHKVAEYMHFIPPQSINTKKLQNGIFCVSCASRVPGIDQPKKVGQKFWRVINQEAQEGR